MSLLVSDYDGTYRTSVEDIEINNLLVRDYIKRGNYFVLSSGRPLDSLMGQVERYNIPYTHLGTSDGSFLFDKDGRLIKSYPVSHDLVKKLDEIDIDDLEVEKEYYYAKGKSLEYIPEDDTLASVSYITRFGIDDEEFGEIFEGLKKSLSDYNLIVYRYGEAKYYLIRPKNVSKSSIITPLQDMFKIPSSEIFTIGDNFNDFEMVKDYNGFMIGNQEDLERVALRKYHAVHELLTDINSKKVLKRM